MPLKRLTNTDKLDISIPYFCVQRCLYLSQILFRFSPAEGGGGTTLTGAAGFSEGFILVVLLKTGEGEQARDMEMEP